MSDLFTGITDAYEHEYASKTEIIHAFLATPGDHE